MQWMYEDGLLKECTSNRELISKFVTSKVGVCKTESARCADARLRGAVRRCTIEARGMRDVSPELNLAR